MNISCIDIKKGWQYYHPFFLSEAFFVLSDDVNFSAIETDSPVGGGKEGVVFSDTDISAREEFGSALADDD
jgi:hypothetical protein